MLFRSKLTYDPLKDFAPVGIHTWLPYAIVVNAQSKLNSYADLRAAALAEPGKLTYASIGNGTTSHLIVLLLQQRTGLKLTHVPYRGSAQAQTDLIGGQVQAAFFVPGNVQPSPEGRSDGAGTVDDVSHERKYSGRSDAVE